MRTILKNARLKKGMTQEQVARAIGVTLRTYIRFENGPVDGSCSTWIALEDLFGVSLRDLRKDFDENGNEKKDEIEEVSQANSIPSKS